MGMLDTRMILVHAGQHETSPATKTGHNLKPLNVYFQNFPFHIFRLQLAVGNQNHRQQNCIESSCEIVTVDLRCARKSSSLATLTSVRKK